MTCPTCGWCMLIIISSSCALAIVRSAACVSRRDAQGTALQKSQCAILLFRAGDPDRAVHAVYHAQSSDGRACMCAYADQCPPDDVSTAVRQACATTPATLCRHAILQVVSTHGRASRDECVLVQKVQRAHVVAVYGGLVASLHLTGGRVDTSDRSRNRSTVEVPGLQEDAARHCT